MESSYQTTLCMICALRCYVHLFTQVCMRSVRRPHAADRHEHGAQPPTYRLGQHAALCRAIRGREAYGRGAVRGKRCGTDAIIRHAFPVLLVSRRAVESTALLWA